MQGEMPQPVLARLTIMRRAVLAGVLLLAIMLVVGLATHPGGYLGTDTGGKVATLESMSRAGRFDPDVGHWAAELDPDGTMHALYYTERIGDRFVNVTTLPMLVVAWPLYEIGGYHGAVAVAALGSLASAFAAAALARRLGRVDPWDAFWVVGLATPAFVYALDLWEHAPGLGLMSWGVVACVDLADGRGGWWTAGLAGMAFGAAGTMRTEALLYGVAFTGASLLVRLLRRRGLSETLTLGAMAVVGVMVPLAANDLLERAVYGGDSFRAGRAGGAFASASVEADRVEEGMLTTFGVFPGMAIPGRYLVGVVVAALIVWAVVAVDRGRSGAAKVAVSGAAALMLASFFAGGIGFVPGMFMASPVAVAGLVAMRGGDGRWLAVTAVACLPAVWFFQYMGGAAPQWGGRYQLLSGFVLTVVGLGVARAASRELMAALAVMGLIVTGCGVVWTVQRTQAVGEAFEVLAARDDPLLVSRSPFFLREGGSVALDERWLTVRDDDQLEMVADWAAAAGKDRIAVLTLAIGEEDPPTVRGWHTAEEERIPLWNDVVIVVQDYRPGRR